MRKTENATADQANTVAAPFGVDDKTIAKEIGASLAWVRKDRRTQRLLPFYKLGDLVRYNPARVQAALLAIEEGGAHIKAKSRKAGVAA